MSLQLKLLGGLSLVDPASTLARVTRRHRLAVLAVLATTDRPVARERLLALIWPDSAEDAARHALGQVLYGLRQDVALGELVTGATDLSLDRSKIGCDLWAFREALKAGDERAALAVYGGPFLDGVQLPNADAFDRWCEEERRVLAQQARDAMESLASRADAAGDFAESVAWWRRLASSDPLSSRVALGCMRALVASGDRAAAIQHARVHAALVRAELEVDADPTVTSYEAELRRTPVVVAAAEPVAAEPVETARTESVLVAPNDPVLVTAEGAPSPSPASESAHVPSRGFPTRIAMAAAVLIAAIAGGIALMRRGSVTAATPATGSIAVVAVLPFDVQGDTTRTFIGEALATLLAGRLDAPGVLRTVESNAVLSAVGRTRTTRETESPAALDARVASLGATLVVHGAVVVLGDRLEISAELRDVNGTGRVERATISGSVDSLFPMADALGAKLLVAREGRSYGSSALGGTNSVPALKALLAGERALRAWKLPDAMAAYQASLAIDSTYALAWFRLAFAEAWAGVGDFGAGSAQHAIQLAANLPDRYAMLLKAMQARKAFDPAGESMLLTLVQRYPDDPDAWEELGEYRMHVGPVFGQPTSNARVPLERALLLDSIGHPEVRVHLAQLAFERGDIAAGRALVSAMIFGDDNDRSVRGGRLILGLIGSGPSTVPQLVRALREAPNGGLMLRLATSPIGILPSARALAESLAVTTGSRETQREGLETLMQMDAGHHDWVRVRRSGDALASLDSLWAADAWGWMAQAPTAMATAAISVMTSQRFGAVLERAALTDSTPRGAQRLLHAAVLSVLARDDAAFMRRTQMLTQLLASRRGGAVSGMQGDKIAPVLRALHARAANDRATFAREMRDVNGPIDWQLARWLKGEALERDGNDADAERWYLSSTWGAVALVITRDAWEKAALIERRIGNAPAADAWAQRARAW